MKILLDYAFPITVVTPTPDASTGFLKQVCLVVKPKAGQTAGTIFETTSMAQVSARTDNLNAAQLFAGGMNRVFLLLADNLQLADEMEDSLNEFFTLLISDDFEPEDVMGLPSILTKAGLTFTAKAIGDEGDTITIALVDGGTAGSETVSVVGKAISVSMDDGVSTANQIKTALDNSAAASALIATTVVTGQGAVAQVAFAADNLEDGADGLEFGLFKGVIGVSSSDVDFLEQQAAIENRVAFFSSALNGADNMAFAFGSLLGNPGNWLNQQYITMPKDDGVDELGEANSFFDKRISFVIADDEFGNRLALFAAGGKAIIAPYIIKNLRVNMQSRALQWIAANQPQYTLKEATLLETRLQEDVIQNFIDRNYLESGTVNITLREANFVANGEIVVPQPKALWRVFAELRETN